MADPTDELDYAKERLQALADLIGGAGETETIDEEAVERHAESIISHVKHRNDAIARGAMEGR